MDEALLNSLLEAKREALDTDNGNFKSTVWVKVVEAVRTAARQQLQITRLICDSRWRNHFKKIWRLWTKHKIQISGWTWDSNKETYTNEEDVMD
jgi:hypothetical protein